ncbi:MAG: GNAT family N-acetyltransferase, partial [Anaerolineae bacterium]|nr:GNAT family N-acetyltransferase [Anaerolineae bacterium]
MRDEELTSEDDLIFQGVQGESDYPLLMVLNRSSRQADSENTAVSLEEIARVFAPSERMDPARDALIAFLADEPARAIGYSRLGWYSSREDTRLYYQVSFLAREYRGRGLWETMVQRNEHRLREIADGHRTVPHRYLQAWASDNQTDWIAALENTGYAVARRFHNMLHRLDAIPHYPLPAGFEVRPVVPEHMRSIWEAQKEMNAGLFENVAEEWLEETYPTWLAEPSHTPQHWQVAWDGDQLAGMVLARIDPDENERLRRKHGYTEHIYVRPPWRRRGLARALIARSLQDLKDHGMEEAE